MRYLLRYLTPALGVVSVIAGAVVVHTTPTSFGWFAYAPLSDSTFVAPVLPQLVLGYGLVVIGLILIAGSIGYAIGRRHRTQ